jgi:hypothetical protein
MAVKVTEGKRKALESKIAGADKVEIKITVANNDEQRAYESLEISRRIAHRREIYFFDTPGLDLSSAGVMLRARAIKGDDNDTVVKIRPIDPEKVNDTWRETNGFKIEADSVGDKVVVSASFKAKQKGGTISKVANGEQDPAALFSKKQKAFFAEFYDGPVKLEDLAVLGPVQALRADIERPGMAYELTAEYWTLPDKSHLLELSIKCPPEEAVVAKEVFEAFLAAHGLDPHGAQATKTKLAMTSLAERLKQE